MKNKIFMVLKQVVVVVGVAFSLVVTPVLSSNENPAALVEQTVQSLLNEFAENRTELEGNTRDLYDLVDRVAAPLFDFDYISKLVLAKSWKGASEEQRAEFAVEFKKTNHSYLCHLLCLNLLGTRKWNLAKPKLKKRKVLNLGL